ncbi:uncharacterized protein LOC143024304 [Oratosquilla oratoria]|uniref:uncharacterized protein LOC143024304 n=1 Tax=Oratosquilla oratoria TaxID=337810 RepID=UPI003F773941
MFDCDSTCEPPDDDIRGSGSPTPPIINVSDCNLEVVYEEELHPIPSPDWTEPLQENGNTPANSASVSKHSTFDPTPLKERKQGRSLKFSPLDSFSKDKDFYTEALDIERKILKETF